MVSVDAKVAFDILTLLDRVESEMVVAAPEIQWTMNGALAEIGTAQSHEP